MIGGSLFQSVLLLKSSVWEIMNYGWNLSDGCRSDAHSELQWLICTKIRRQTARYNLIWMKIFPERVKNHLHSLALISQNPDNWDKTLPSLHLTPVLTLSGARLWNNNKSGAANEFEPRSASLLSASPQFTLKSFPLTPRGQIAVAPKLWPVGWFHKCYFCDWICFLVNGLWALESKAPPLLAPFYSRRPRRMTWSSLQTGPESSWPSRSPSATRVLLGWASASKGIAPRRTTPTSASSWSPSSMEEPPPRYDSCYD